MGISQAPRFADGILAIASAYGGDDFWLENLVSEASPEAIWRALLVYGCRRRQGHEAHMRRLLTHSDSRVRGWACFALSQVGDSEAAERMDAMRADPSSRVRAQARRAIAVLGSGGAFSHLCPSAIPPDQSLILISEDDANTRAMYEAFLTAHGYRVALASTEEETRSLALALRPQMILTDNQKGRGNLSGLNMTWDIARTHELRETVIIMVTADSAEPVFLWNGGDYFVHKPCDMLSLLVAVNEYLLY